MKKYGYGMKGFTPLVWNRQTMELREIIKGLKKDELEENEYKNWKMKAEISNGNAIIPPDWIIGCLINSAKQTRIVPWFATTKSQTYTNYVSNFKIDVSKPIVVGKASDLKRKEGMFPSQGKSNRGGKVLRCHPILEKWQADVEIVDIMGKMKKIELETLLDWGGKMVGIGDQRYAQFGRFEVKNLKEVEL